MGRKDIMKSKRNYGYVLKKYSLLDLKLKEYKIFLNTYFGNNISNYEKNFLLKTAIEQDITASVIPIELFLSELYEN